MFNKHNKNIVEKNNRNNFKNIGVQLNPKLDEITIREIVENYRSSTA